LRSKDQVADIFREFHPNVERETKGLSNVFDRTIVANTLVHSMSIENVWTFGRKELFISLPESPHRSPAALSF